MCRITGGMAAAGLALLSLSGCMSVPEFHVGTERVDGAFVSTDGRLYLLGTLRTAVFDAAPFRAYRELMDSPLKDAVACTRLNYRLDVKGNAPAETVRGTCAMLLHADRVSPEQAARFGLQRLDVAALDDPARVPDRYLNCRPRLWPAFRRRPVLQRAVRGRRHLGAPARYARADRKKPAAHAHRGAAGSEPRRGAAVQPAAGGGGRGGDPGIPGFHPFPGPRSLEVI